MSENLKTFTDNNFNVEVLQSKIPVLVDFWAPWCKPCLALAPIIEELALQYKDKIIIGKINVDENPEIPSKYMIFSIPTLILFKNGEAVEQIIGFNPKSELVKFIDKNIA